MGALRQLRKCKSVFRSDVLARTAKTSLTPGAVKIAMTGSAADGPDFQRHLQSKTDRDKLANRARDSDDDVKLMLVLDMWVAGFDAPCMHTMYIDKPMRH